MSELFLDQEKPLSTCKNRDCKNCSVSPIMNCHFNIKQLIKFIIMVLPPALISGYAIFVYNPIFIIPWILMFISFFGFIEIRVMCSHCPHYAEPGLKTLKCWANYGSPKIWKYRPGPMSLTEKIVFFTGFTFIFGYPVPFYILKATVLSYIFLGLYAVSFVIAARLLKKYYCSRCMNFTCPLNSIDNEKRKLFFESNPVVGEAWNNK